MRAVPLLAVALLVPGACGEPARPPAFALADLPTVVLTCGEPGDQTTILEVNGNGAALVDLDGDGDLDIVLTDGSTRARWLAGEPVQQHVLRNDGVADGVPRFTRVTEDTGLVMAGWPTGIAAGDVDRDGRPDLVIGGLGEDALFLNRTVPGGPLRFDKQVLPGRRSPLDWTTSVALADGDGDGRLDAYLARYLTIDVADPPMDRIGNLPCRFLGHPVMCGPQGLPAQGDAYLRGVDLGEHGLAFVDATDAAGIGELPPAYGLGVLFMDLDQDGDADVYVANDSVDNHMLANDGRGHFVDVSSASGAASDVAGRAQAGMGVDAGDVDGDGDFDVVVTNFSAEANALYRQDRPLLFRDVSTAAGLAQSSRPLLGWGVHLADFDADGRLDLAFANGHVYPQADLPDTGTSYAQPVMLLPGDGAGRFGSNAFPDPTPRVGRCIVRGDLDGDGDLDLVLLPLDGAPLLYVNRSDDPGRQLLVSLSADAPGDDGRWPAGGADAFGATLRLTGPEGLVVRQKRAGSGFQGCNDPRLHVGAPGPFVAAPGPFVAAEVLWPGGELETLDPAAFVGGRHVHVVRGRGVVDSTPLEHIP